MITRVEGTNFRSYHDLALDFGTSRVSVVYGQSQSDYADSNGTGKTSLMYLVLWTLYGKWPGMESAESCIRQPANKDCSGIVSIRKNDGIWRVARYRKDSTHKNNVFVYPPNSVTPISGDMKVVQDRIESLIGMNYDTFIKTMVFTGSDSETFAKMTDKQQKDLLDTIVPMDFQALHEKAKDRMKFAEGTVNECNGVVKGITDWLARNEDEQFRLDEEITSVMEQFSLEGMHASLEEAKNHVATFERTLQKQEEEKNQRRAALEQAEKAYTDYRPTMDGFETAAERWAQYKSSTEMIAREGKLFDQGIESRERELTELNHRLAADQQGKTCHTCGQALGPEALQKAVSSTQGDIDRLKNHLAVIRKDREQMVADYTKRVQESGFDETSAAKFEADYGAAKTHTKGLEQYRDELTRQYRLLEDQIRTNQQNRQAWQAKVTEIEQALENLQDPAKEMKERQRVLTAEHERLTKDLAAARNNQTEWANTAALWSNVVDMFSGGKNSLQHFLFESMLPEMSATAQMFLSMFSQNELTVAFKSHKKKGSKTVEGFFVEALKGANTKGYGDMSGGERRRIDLCIFLTIYLLASKHVFSPGVIFLDEIADFMDDTGQQQVVSVLEFFCQQYGVSCLLLTNKRELVASVAHGYRCALADGTSQLVSVQET